ncbi:MAG TPA: TetR/AcrR family transcriptional regulator [Roseiflexaceae bacterium]|nr:TetR/AcrR family transcriptional regulator [Roseiflexaceae bacterium]
MTKKAPRETRLKLLWATVAVILGEGAAHLTLDAVAREACVSKGGLLHHFPTKKHLLQGLIEFSVQTWEQRLAQELALEPDDKPGRWCRAYIRTCLDLSAEEANLTLALTKATSVFPECFADFQNKTWPRINDDGLPPGRALVIQSACDALWLNELTGMPPLNQIELAQMRTELMRLTE